ncbi:integrase, catalytic region, zinc finger, CCHC-type containing protein [Tanacetum coccineum]
MWNKEEEQSFEQLKQAMMAAPILKLPNFKEDFVVETYALKEDIYAAGFENHPLMLNKDNYVPWFSQLLRYTKSKPNGKLLVNSIIHGPYNDDELTEKEAKQMKADDQTIQTILMGLPEDIYDVVDSCETAQEIWFTSTDRESIESYYHRFSKLMNEFKRNKHFPKKIASNLKFINNLQLDWKCHITIVRQTKDLHQVDYNQLYDFLKMNQEEVNELRAERLAKTYDPLALMENSHNPYNYPVFHPDHPSQITYMQQPQPNNNFVGQNGVQNPSIQNVGNQNGLIVVPGIANQNANQNRNGNVVAARAEGNGNGKNDNQRRCYNYKGLGIQLQAKEFDLMATAGDIDEIEEVNANFILMANLQQASTLEVAKFKEDFKSLTKEAGESLNMNKVLKYENERILRAVVSQDIMSIVQNTSVVDTSNLQTELEHMKEKFENVDTTAKTRRPQPRSNTKNDRVSSTSKSSCIKNKEVKVVEHPRNLLFSKNQTHMSSGCNNIKLVIRNDKSKVIYAMCKQCLITANHDVCVLNYVNDMNSCADNQNANVSKVANPKIHKPKVKKSKKLGSKERLASSKPRKPRTYLRWPPTGRIDYYGKIIEYSDFECKSDTYVYDDANASNPQEPTNKWFLNSTFFLDSLSKFVYGASTQVVQAYDQKSEAAHQLRVKVYGNYLEVAFRRNTYFVINLKGVDMLKGNRTTNLYNINLYGMASASPICLMARATSTKSWNNHEDIGKLGAKGDIGFFIGYSANSCTYRVYNQRTKKIMETMNVTFDKLLAMAFKQHSLKLKLQGMTSTHINSGLDVTYAPSIITS